MKFTFLLLFTFFLTYSCTSDDFELYEKSTISKKKMSKDSIQSPTLNNKNDDCETIWNCSKTDNILYDSIQSPTLNNKDDDCETIWNCSKTN